jgi:hypothetical protein
MKGLKLSKASWLILAAGIFLIVLAGLGLTRSQQLKEQTRLDEELTLSEKRLSTLQTAQLTQQLENLKVKVEENEAQVKDAQARLDQTVISVDVADEFYKIANYCSVNITSLTTSKIANLKYMNIHISTTSLSAAVTGDKQNIIDFIISLNNGFITGKMGSISISFGGAEAEEENPDSEEEEEEPEEGEELATGTASASISMLIYSYEVK